jgi:hypothetical protein
LGEKIGIGLGVLLGAGVVVGGGAYGAYKLGSGAYEFSENIMGDHRETNYRILEGRKGPLKMAVPRTYSF